MLSDEALSEMIFKKYNVNKLIKFIKSNFYKLDTRREIKKWVTSLFYFEFKNINLFIFENFVYKLRVLILKH